MLAALHIDRGSAANNISEIDFMMAEGTEMTNLGVKGLEILLGLGGLRVRREWDSLTWRRTVGVAILTGSEEEAAWPAIYRLMTHPAFSD